MLSFSALSADRLNGTNKMEYKYILYYILQYILHGIHIIRLYINDEYGMWTWIATAFSEFIHHVYCINVRSSLTISLLSFWYIFYFVLYTFLYNIPHVAVDILKRYIQQKCSTFVIANFNLYKSTQSIKCAHSQTENWQFLTIKN